MGCFDRALSVAGRLWFETQVELHGHYSVEHLHAFEQYHARTTWLRALSVCLLTPLPCIFIVICVDLLPLEPPDRGARGSPMVWLRAFLTVFGISVCILEQFRHHIHSLPLARSTGALISVISSAASVLACFSLSSAFGYPFPFTMLVGTIPWFVTLVIMLLLLKQREIRCNHRAARDVLQYHAVFMCQIFMTIIYPLYNHAFSGLTSLQQTAFVFVLPLIKIFAKNWISRTLQDSDDAKPEAVVFNVEIFHSLFVSCCMQNTASIRTVFALMMIDVVQAWLSFRDVLAITSELHPIASKLDAARQRSDSIVSRSRVALHSIVDLANQLVETEPQHASRARARVPAPHQSISRSVAPTIRGRISGLSQFFGRHIIQIEPSQDPPPKVGTTTTSVMPLPAVRLLLPSDLKSLNVVERGVLVRQTQRLLYVTEFIVLVEYTEVIMPMIYNIYLLVMYNLPNKEYYTFLHGLTATELLPTITNVLLYASLELVSLVCMASLLWWKLRLSLVHQLAFVLEARMANIQAKLLLWVLDIMQTAIVQFGPDYSFQFDWLRSPVPPA